MTLQLTEEEIQTFERDGAICLRGVFSADWISKTTNGIEYNLRNPSMYAERLQGANSAGVYFNDYCNWTKIPEFKDFVLNSPAAAIAGQLMRSDNAIFYHEHVLVKDSGTDKSTPWHADLPYYPVDASQCLSIWMPVDPVDVNSALTFVAGSHRWPQWFMPRRFATRLNYPLEHCDTNGGGRAWVNVPRDDVIEKERLLRWSLNPGDCVVFHMKTLHGAPGNLSIHPRRILSTRWLGDDAVIASRPWITSPPTTGMLEVGQPVAASQEFPTVWKRNN